MLKILPQHFFEQPTLVVAQGLLGKYLVRRVGRKTIIAMITEVEAYDGFKDRASHAARGQTARNAPMFGPAGHWYVYFTYGMHWLANIVCGVEGYPAAVLIRGVVVNMNGGTRKQELVINGPARVTKFFKIGKAQNGKSATKKSGLWIAEPTGRGRLKVSKFKVKTSPRIGVAYAGPHWSRRRWNFRLETKNGRP